MTATDITINNVTSITSQAKASSSTAHQWTELEIECSGGIKHTIALWGEDSTRRPVVHGADDEPGDGCPGCGCYEFNPDCDECIDAKAQEAMRTDQPVRPANLPASDLLYAYRQALVNTVHTCQEWGANPNETGSPDAEDVLDSNMLAQVDHLRGEHGGDYLAVRTALEDAANSPEATEQHGSVVPGDLVASLDFPQGRRDLWGGLASYQVGVVEEITDKIEGCRRYKIRVLLRVWDGIPEYLGDGTRFIKPPVNGTPTSMGNTCDGVVVLQGSPLPLGRDTVVCDACGATAGQRSADLHDGCRECNPDAHPLPPNTAVGTEHECNNASIDTTRRGGCKNCGQPDADHVVISNNVICPTGHLS